MRFSDVLGHGDIKALLSRSVDDGRVSHAQVFSGMDGAGTLPLALAYAQYLNCTDRKGGDSCGVCASCHKMANVAHPDVHYVFPITSKSLGSTQKPISDNYITQWREIVKATGGYFDQTQWYDAIEVGANQQGFISRAEANEVIRKLSFKAYESRYKIVVIWMAEKMRVEASNALLKILEEPWDNTLFLMVSGEVCKLLPTITSRVQEIAVAGIAQEELETFLRIKHGVEQNKASVIARLSRGSMIHAQRLLLGAMDEDGDESLGFFIQLMRLSYNDRHMELLDWAESVSLLGREQQKRLLIESLRLLRESYMLNAGMDEVSYLWGAELAFCNKFYPYIGNHNIDALTEEIELAISQLGQNGNAKIIFSHFALSISKMVNRV